MPIGKNWGIRTRLLLITMLPVVYLFVSVIGYSWQSRRFEAREELAERGKIVARALALSLEYNLVSRNVPAMKLAIHSLVQSDESIYRIKILDVNHKELVHDTSELAQTPEQRYFEAEIQKQLIWVSVIGGGSQPQNGIKPPNKTRETVGFVQVQMSPGVLRAKQTQRFGLELTMALLALAVAGFLIYYLAKSLILPLKKSVEAVLDIRSGRYGTQIAVSTGGEIGQLQAAINNMAQSLQQATQNLENKVQERTQDLIASRNEALKADAEKRRLIQKVHTIVEDERKSIAIEIHDELNASLIAARLEAERITQLATQLTSQFAAHPSAGAASAEIADKARSITHIARELYANGRSLVRRLRPEILEMLGLPGAVEDLQKHYNASPDNCHFALDVKGDFAQLDSAVAISAFRIIQEALSNIVKHAQANHAVVVLELDRTLGQLRITVSDDGIGFLVEAPSQGLGLTGMRERVAAFQGSLLVQTDSANGTCIEIVLPLACGGSFSP